MIPPEDLSILRLYDNVFKQPYMVIRTLHDPKHGASRTASYHCNTLLQARDYAIKHETLEPTIYKRGRSPGKWLVVL